MKRIHPPSLLYIGELGNIMKCLVTITSIENKMCALLSFVQLLILLAVLSFSEICSTQGTEFISPREAKEQQSSTLRTYIVHLKKPHDRTFAEFEDLQSWHQSFLPMDAENMNLNPLLVHSYRNVVTGFAARMTAEQVKAMEEKDEVLLVRPETRMTLHTTHSPTFLGLHQEVGFWNESNFGKGVIIGVLDSGIWPGHPSFSDAGMPPPPLKWKGKCHFKTCNNKIIGARNFQIGYSAAPEDEDGHGTYTASIAAGNFVKRANLLGQAYGTAVGMAPLAHLAIYKVCSKTSCSESDVLAGLDAAIEDGVDLLSVSFGPGPIRSFVNDIMAIGAFQAIQKGIFVSASAGNIGPFNGRVGNAAPWILTVGASTTDRSIQAMAGLGNGEEFEGESIYQPMDFNSKFLPLVHPTTVNYTLSGLCNPGTLQNVSDMVKGKVVLCQGSGGRTGIVRGEEVKKYGGVAMILMNEELDGFSTSADVHVLPATHVSYAAGLKIKAYINSTSTPTAAILYNGTVTGKSSAPMILSLSSRGPSRVSPGILKPDIVGPGANILAAWPFFDIDIAKIDVPFYVTSGTSVACPHLTGIAALLKSSHPDWSPAAIKSAMMTTADVLNLEGNPILDYNYVPAKLFATGAGQVNPSKANDPGLVYDIKPDDYFPYLCGLNYTDKEIEVITRKVVKCSEVKSIPESQLNYPSFSISLGWSPQTVSRTVTNVGLAASTYSVKVFSPRGLSIRVMPEEIVFTRLKQTATYTVTFSRKSEGKTHKIAAKSFAQGFLKWASSELSVRSPISVMFK